MAGLRASHMLCRGASVTRRLLIGAGGLLGAAAAAAGAARAEEDARKGEVST
jgi:hypothetical protein